MKGSGIARQSQSLCLKFALLLENGLTQLITPALEVFGYRRETALEAEGGASLLFEKFRTSNQVSGIYV